MPEEGVLAMQACEPLMRKSDDALAGLRLAVALGCTNNDIGGIL